MIGHEIKVETADGPFMAYIAVPDGATKAPAVVVIQEIFGVNQNMRSIVHDYAALGYIAISPDLFWRQEPGIQLTDQTEAEWAKAFELYKGFDVAMGIADIQATIDTVRAHSHSTGKVGAVGFCLGGLLAYLSATRTNVDAAVGYYGVGIEGHLDEAAKITKQVLLHVAELDQYCPPPAQAQLKSAFATSDKVSVEFYPGCDHAFSRIGGQHFDAAASKLAAERTTTLFKKALA